MTAVDADDRVRRQVSTADLAGSARMGVVGRRGGFRLSPWHQRRAQAPIYRHPVNRLVFETAPLGARVADRVTGYMGSWRFIVVQTVLVGLWLGANVLLLARPFDPFPFILLNLAFSTQAAYAAPLILLAGNRASQRDRLTLEHAAAEGDLGDAQNERLLHGNIQILQQVAALEARILGMEQTILAAVAPSRGPGELGTDDSMAFRAAAGAGNEYDAGQRLPLDGTRSSRGD